MLVVAQYDHISVFSHLNGDDLYEEIVDTYKPDVVLTYGMARDTMFSKIDGVNDSLECIYTGMKRYLIPGEDPTQAVYLDGAPNGINTEHSYPQSKGASDGNARSDMHHLYP
ncbi:MAG TPA: endonuclease I, partial [Saprospirales bacterium]|nr:endonuclease I [Saprospirales bacterium]